MYTYNIHTHVSARILLFLAFAMICICVPSGYSCWELSSKPVALLRGGRTHKRPNVRKVGHYGCTLEEDIGTKTPSSLFISLLPWDNHIPTIMFCLPAGPKTTVPNSDETKTSETLSQIHLSLIKQIVMGICYSNRKPIKLLRHLKIML